MEPSSLKRKICLLGAFGVGKTSLVRQFVHSEFSDAYHSTMGVKVDKKVLQVGDCELTMVIWDVAGEEEFFQVPDSYVQGAQGFLFVADGTRQPSLATMLSVRHRFQNPDSLLPEVILLNKADLEDEWALDENVEANFEAEGLLCLRTSAADGRNVEAAFQKLAEQMLAVR